MKEYLTAPNIALIVSVAMMVMTYLSLRNKAGKDRVDELEKRLAEADRRLVACEEKLRECERSGKELMDRNIQLMNRMFNCEEKNCPFKG